MIPEFLNYVPEDQKIKFKIPPVLSYLRLCEWSPYCEITYKSFSVHFYAIESKFKEYIYEEMCSDSPL